MAINIDISNYEEYLLSAVDGELNEEEQVALEAFLQQHPVLRQEFLLLQSARLVPDEELRFEGKEGLYKKATHLSAENYESYLLDYVDNELNTADRKKVEALAQQHQHINRDLKLLEATRLQPDLTVYYPDKALLYKRHNKVRPIWWWTAAAAIVAGVAVIVIPAQHTQTGPQLAKEQPATSQPLPAVTKEQREMATKNPAGVAEVSTATASTLGKPLIAANKPSVHQQSLQTGDVAAPAPAKETSIPGKHQGLPESRQDENSATAALTHLPQPESTTSEVVQALKEQKERQAEQVAIRNATDEEADKVPVMAKSTTIKDNVVNTRESEATRPVQGELVVSVTMRGDSRILNGVANVARFFSKKKK